MFRCGGSWVTLSAFPPAEFAQTDLLQATFRTLVSTYNNYNESIINNKNYAI